MPAINVIIETPKGSAQKFNLDLKTGYFKLKKIMPTGLVFPYDFGFIEGTVGEDGDPLDVIVISEFETFPGCSIECRIIGAIKAKQRERDGDEMRNDRYIGIPIVSRQYEAIKDLKDFPKKILGELEAFFANYNAQAGKRFSPLERINAKKASAMLRKAKKERTAETKLIQLFLPMFDPEGKPFPKTRFDAVIQKLTGKFNGLSVYENMPVIGLWKDDSNLEKDKLIIFEVMSDVLETDFWEKYRADLQKQFKQESILVRCLHMNMI
ncbi:MAG: inorganic diphosphatase [Pedobacter sp.]|nr:inorganic diphosphatase [Pedobacter sp.]